MTLYEALMQPCAACGLPLRSGERWKGRPLPLGTGPEAWEAFPPLKIYHMDCFEVL